MHPAKPAAVRPVGIRAGAAAAGRQGRCLGRLAGGGEHRELFFQVQGMAGGAFGHGAGTHQGFKGVAAVVAGVFVDGHGRGQRRLRKRGAVAWAGIFGARGVVAKGLARAPVQSTICPCPGGAWGVCRRQNMSQTGL